ncbi:MAG: enoyl-CoA hydratase [Frankiaceae bacterium]|nr:enoyl-CoA hydratase [Frankiaceae bacterium]
MIRAARRGAVALLTIDRPERRNAVNADMCDALLDGLRDALGADARVLVLTGAGGHFCAGADLGGVEDDRFRIALRTFLLALADAPIPTIAAVEGFALGAGMQLAAACDLRVAAPDARFGIPAAKLGLMVDHWTVRRVQRVAGEGTARAMLLAAEEVDGDAAVRLGLAQRSGRLEDALSWADQIALLAPLTLAGHKLALNRFGPEPEPDALVDAAIAKAWGSADLREGMVAFKERRRPHFKGE